MIQEILNNCSIEGNSVKLPPTHLDRDTYKQVADKLKKIGGEWTGGKTRAFVFTHNPTELLAKIQSGEKVNLKKDFQFFETPPALAKRLVTLLEQREYLESFDSSVILEPSAGNGAIIRELPSYSCVDYYEINPLCQVNNFPNILRKAFRGANFLEADESVKYERIVANPPFSKNQDIDHIRKMYSVLADGGRLVSIASRHWQSSTNKKETDFRLWLADIGAVIYEVEAGAFKESGTNIPTVIIEINK